MELIWSSGREIRKVEQIELEATKALRFTSKALDCLTVCLKCEKSRLVFTTQLARNSRDNF